MAVGEFVSVSQQADTERADVEKERKAQETPESQAVELRELADIYKGRGLDAALSLEVARQLTAHDAVRAHARDELGIDIDEHPSAWQAAFASAVRNLPLHPVLVLPQVSEHLGCCRFASKPFDVLTVHASCRSRLHAVRGSRRSPCCCRRSSPASGPTSARSHSASCSSVHWARFWAPFQCGRAPHGCCLAGGLRWRSRTASGVRSRRLWHDASWVDELVS